MPPHLNPKNLTQICLNNIATNMETYWYNEYAKQILDTNKIPLYIIGPFEILNDENVEYVLKKLTEIKLLNRNFMYLLMHNRLKCINLGFLRNRCFVNASLTKFIGNNCYVSLSFFFFFFFFFISSKAS